MSEPIYPLTPEQAAIAQAHALKEGYIYRLAKGLDEFGNVVTGGNLGQSLSSRIGLDASKGDEGAILLAQALNITFSPDHVVKAEAADLAQAEKVEEVEESSTDLPATVKGE